MRNFLAVMTVVSQTTHQIVFGFFDPTLLNKQDVNNDGYISQDEMHPPPSGGWSEFLHFSDGNGDGRLSLPEAQTALKKTLDLISSNPFDAGISLADKDSDGFLTQRELSSREGNYGEAEWKQYVEDFDMDGDGRLSVEEYSKGIANLGEELGLDQGVLPSHPQDNIGLEEAAIEKKVEQSQSQIKESQTEGTTLSETPTLSSSQKPSVFQPITTARIQMINYQLTTEKTSSAVCPVAVISLGLLILSTMIVHGFL